MLENIYTTKMSANMKQLQSRFFKIYSQKQGQRKVLTIFITMTVVLTILCANIVLAMVGSERKEQYKIEVKHENTVIHLDNKPFVYDNTVYLPLRELMEKVGLLEHKESYMNWDNGKIEMNLTEKAPKEQNATQVKYLSYYYGLEIGIAEYTLNPGMEKMYKQRWNISNSKKMKHAPILKDGITYIPFEFVEYIINRSMQTTYITCFAWDLSYNSNTERKADYINDSISTDYADYYGKSQQGAINLFKEVSDINVKNKTSVCNAFFKAFEIRDFELMKMYCTESCIDNHFVLKEPAENSSVFGMSRAVMKNISVPYSLKESEQEILYVTVDCDTPPQLSIIGGERIIKLFFEKQADGSYLIDDFAF